MPYNPLFVSSENRNLQGKKLPMVSQALDSVRAYQWEITFYSVPVDPAFGANGGGRPLTLAAKSVSQTGYTIEDIEVHRVNDKVFYPGKASTEELTVQFDNIYQTKMSSLLYEWIKTIYNPVTGEFENNRQVTLGSVAGNFKTVADIVQLDNKGKPMSFTRLYGIYPKSWKQAEFNYSTNEFHTIEVTFRYDFIVQNANTNT
jgi:hypothetical protein